MNGFEHYVMSYGAPITQDRWAEFAAGKLDINHTVVFMQDVLESGILMSLTPEAFVLAQHCVNMGLCHVDSRGLH